MKVVGYTTGVFDLFHIGHLNILRRARAECDHLIVGVTTDHFTYFRKGRYPVIPFEERIEIVASIRYVDAAVPQTSLDVIAAWEKLRFQKIFKGDDWKGTPEWRKTELELSGVGAEVVYFPYTNHTSSTILRTALQRMESSIPQGAEK